MALKSVFLQFLIFAFATTQGAYAEDAGVPEQLLIASSNAAPRTAGMQATT